MACRRSGVRAPTAPLRRPARQRAFLLSWTSAASRRAVSVRRGSLYRVVPSAAEGVAAAEAPEAQEAKAEMREATDQQKKSVQDYIMETYGRKNPSGLSGAETFGITSGVTGITERSS